MQRLSQNTFTLLLNNIITAGLAFVLTILISRGLGDVAFGRYATVMAWVLPFTILADFGLNTLITRHIAASPEHAQYLLSSTHPLRLLIGLCIIITMGLGAVFLNDDPQIVESLRIAILLAVIDAFFGSYTAVFRAWGVMWPILLMNTLFFLLQIGGAVFIIWQDGSIVALFACIVLADVVQLGLTWALWRGYFRHHYPRPKPSTPQGRLLLFQALPFTIAGVLAMVHMRVMILVIDAQLPTAEVGWYAAAFRISEAARMAPNALFVALFPRLSALAENPSRFESLFRRAAALLIIYGLLFALAMVLLAPYVVSFLFGNTFAPAAPVLALLSWALIPASLRALLTLRLYAIHAEALVNYSLTIGLAVQIGVGYVLVLSYRLQGAALAVIIGETILMVCLGLAMRHKKVKNSSAKV